MINKTILTFLLSSAAVLTACNAEEPNTAAAPMQSTEKTNVEKETTITNVTKLMDGVHMIEGRGGNVMISVGDDGVLMIDDQFGQTAGDILDEVEKITGKREVTYVLNTHYHGDHTGGNAVMHEHGATIMAHKNVRKRMKANADIKGEAVNPNELPVIGYHKDMHVHFNGLDFSAYHWAHAHTDGDSVIVINDQNIIHMGDTYFQNRFPYIDVAGGGDIDSYIRNMAKALEVADADTKIIPGHGPLSNKAEMQIMHDQLVEMRDIVFAELKSGKSVADVKAANPLATYDALSWAFIDTEKFTGAVIDSYMKKHADREHK